MPCFLSIRWKSQWLHLKYWIKQCGNLLVKQNNTARVHVLKHPPCLPREGQSYRNCLLGANLADAMLWAGPGHCEENHNLSRSKAWNYTLPFFSWPMQVWPKRALGVSSTALFLGESKPEEAGLQQTPTPAQLHHSCKLAAGKEWGTWSCPHFEATGQEQLQWNWWNCLNIIWE